MQSENPQATAAAQPASRKRPRLDLAAAADNGGRERKRGRGMLGLVLGTLNKAKVEDKERNASDAVCVVLWYNINSSDTDHDLKAKKRQLIDQRLQAKLRKEIDSVRRAEEAKKDKTSANRREEELQVKDSIVCTIALIFPRFLIHLYLVQTSSDKATFTLQLPLDVRSHTNLQ